MLVTDVTDLFGGHELCRVPGSAWVLLHLQAPPLGLSHVQHPGVTQLVVGAVAGEQADLQQMLEVQRGQGTGSSSTSCCGSLSPRGISMCRMTHPIGLAPAEPGVILLCLLCEDHKLDEWLQMSLTPVV